jgi:hypothetical protein
MRGSIQRAKIRTQWLGLSLFIPLFTHFYLKSNVSIEYWTWMPLCTLGSIWFFMYFSKQAWKKVQDRFISAMVNKIMNYHLICMSSLMNEDYTKVKYILSNCLEKYDPKSTLTFFIIGAHAAGTKDKRPIKDLKKQLEMIKV